VLLLMVEADLLVLLADDEQYGTKANDVEASKAWLTASSTSSCCCILVTMVMICMMCFVVGIDDADDMQLLLLSL